MSGIVVTNPSRRTSNIVVRTTSSGGLVPSSATQITLTGQISSTVKNRLDELTDVIEGNYPENNQTLVYDSSSDKYIVGYLPIDGGSF